MPKDKSDSTNFLLGATALVVGLYFYNKSVGQTSTPLPPVDQRKLQPGISTASPELQDTPIMVTPSDVLSAAAFEPQDRLIPSPWQSLSSSVDPTNVGSIFSSTGIYF
jgi:hypothetical protein